MFSRHAPAYALYAVWALWAASWLIAARSASAVAKRPREPAERVAVILIVLGFAALFAEPPGQMLSPRLWTPAPALAWAMVAVTLAAFGFAWWARLHLGALWSFRTSAKAGHRVVQTGPYALVRHPIYAALLVAALAKAGAKGTTLSLAGVVILAIGFWVKAGVEERFLAAELGSDAYGDYARRVRRLIPFIL
jgi:protein-S-isoprenylcysteine O-methyltransferase Ste14